MSISSLKAKQLKLLPTRNVGFVICRNAFNLVFRSAHTYIVPISISLERDRRENHTVAMPEGGCNGDESNDDD